MNRKSLSFMIILIGAIVILSSFLFNQPSLDGQDVNARIEKNSFIEIPFYVDDVDLTSVYINCNLQGNSYFYALVSDKDGDYMFDALNGTGESSFLIYGECLGDQSSWSGIYSINWFATDFSEAANHNNLVYILIFGFNEDTDIFNDEAIDIEVSYYWMPNWNIEFLIFGMAPGFVFIILGVMNMVNNPSDSKKTLRI